jgi:hypothetical protein
MCNKSHFTLSKHLLNGRGRRRAKLLSLPSLHDGRSPRFFVTGTITVVILVNGGSSVFAIQEGRSIRNITREKKIKLRLLQRNVLIIQRIMHKLIKYHYKRCNINYSRLLHCQLFPNTPSKLLPTSPCHRHSGSTWLCCRSGTIRLLVFGSSSGMRWWRRGWCTQLLPPPDGGDGWT